MEKLKTFQPKNNSGTTNSPPALSRRSSINNTTQIIVVTQTFDGDQTQSVSWIKII